MTDSWICLHQQVNVTSTEFNRMYTRFKTTNATVFQILLVTDNGEYESLWFGTSVDWVTKTTDLDNLNLNGTITEVVIRSRAMSNDISFSTFVSYVYFGKI